MKIEVLGTGCPKCNALEASARKVADELGLDYELVHVKDIGEITARGVMMTPALMVDGELKVSGRVPGDGELAGMLSKKA